MKNSINVNLDLTNYVKELSLKEIIKIEDILEFKELIPSYFGHYSKTQFDGRRTEMEIEQNSIVFKLKEGIINKETIPLIDDILDDITCIYRNTHIDYITYTPDSGNKEGNIKQSNITCFSVIIEYIAKKLGIPVFLPEITKEMKKQKTMSKNERLNNKRGGYKFDENKIKGKNILFIDDVVTTGSTMFAIAEDIVKKGGKFFAYAVSQAELDDDKK